MAPDADSLASVRIEQATQLWQPMVDAVWQDIVAARSVFRGFPMWHPMHFRIGDTNFERVMLLVTASARWPEPAFVMPAPDMDRVAIGIAAIERDNFPHGANLAIALRPGCHGFGAGTKAFGLLIEYAFTLLNLNRVESFGYTNNPASLRMQARFMKQAGVMRQAGYAPEGYVDRVMFDLLRSEWEGRRAAEKGVA